MKIHENKNLIRKKNAKQRDTHSLTPGEKRRSPFFLCHLQQFNSIECLNENQASATKAFVLNSWTVPGIIMNPTPHMLLVVDG